MNLREDLKAYVDRELPPDRMAEIEAALRADPVLRAEVDEIRGLSLAVRALVTTPEPVGLEKTLRALQRRPWWSPAGMQGRLAWGAAAAVLIVVAFATLLPREGIRDAATMSETATWAKQPTTERAAMAPDVEAKPESAVGGAAPGAPPAMARKVAPDNAANLSRAMETTAPSVDALPSTPDQEVTQGAAEAHVNKSYVLDDVPFNTTVRFRVADPKRAEAELQAVAAPLGGYAVRKDGEILVEIPKDRRDDALREMRRFGSVEEVPGEDLRPRRAGSDTVTITAKVEPASEPLAPSSPETNGRAWVLASLVGIAIVALAGLVWSLRRR